MSSIEGNQDSGDVWRDPRVRAGMDSYFAGLEQRGEELVGWKLGLGAPAAMEAAGTSGPLLSGLTAATALADGAEVEIEGWTKAALEPELAIHLGSDLDGDAGPEEAAAAIGGLGLAYELVDLSLPPSEVEEILGGGMFHRAYMLGPVDGGRRGGDTAGISFAVRNGEGLFAQSDDPEQAVGGMVDLTRHAAGYLASFGRGLEAGQFVITGSLVPPAIVSAGERYSYAAAGLGELTVSFA